MRRVGVRGPRRLGSLPAAETRERCSAGCSPPKQRPRPAALQQLSPCAPARGRATAHLPAAGRNAWAAARSRRQKRGAGACARAKAGGRAAACGRERGQGRIMTQDARRCARAPRPRGTRRRRPPPCPGIGRRAGRTGRCPGGASTGGEPQPRQRSTSPGTARKAPAGRSPGWKLQRDRPGGACRPPPGRSLSGRRRPRGKWAESRPGAQARRVRRASARSWRRSPRPW